MPAPGLRSNAEQYDLLFIDGLPVPGIWYCEEIGAGYKLKQPKGSGDDGGEARITGLDISKGNIVIDLRTDEDEAQWETLLKRIRPLDKPSGRGPVALSNPQFARHGITQIIVVKASEQKVRPGGPTKAHIEWHSTRHKTGKTKKATSTKEGTAPGNVFEKKTGTIPPVYQQIIAAGGR